jgi:hypothetical protein
MTHAQSGGKPTGRDFTTYPRHGYESVFAADEPALTAVLRFSRAR